MLLLLRPSRPRRARHPTTHIEGQAAPTQRTAATMAAHAVAVAAPSTHARALSMDAHAVAVAAPSTYTRALPPLARLQEAWWPPPHVGPPTAAPQRLLMPARQIENMVERAFERKGH